MAHKKNPRVVINAFIVSACRLVGVNSVLFVEVFSTNRTKYQEYKQAWAYVKYRTLEVIFTSMSMASATQGSVVGEKNSQLQKVKLVALLVQLMNDKFAPTFHALWSNMTSESTLVWALPGSPSVRLMWLGRNVHGLHSVPSDENYKMAGHSEVLLSLSLNHRAIMM